MPRPVYPIPEALGGRWSVKRGRPRVDLTAKEMFIPVGNSEADRFVRAHEMGHVAITPAVEPGAVAKKHGIPVECVQVCEDYRVHVFLSRKGIDRPGHHTQEELDALGPHFLKDPADLLRTAVAFSGTDDIMRLRNAVVTAIARLPVGQQQSARAMVSSINRMCSRVTDRITSPVKHRQQPLSRSGFRFNTIPAAQLLDHFCNSMAVAQHIEGERTVSGENKWDEIANRTGTHADWCPMRVAHASLAVARTDHSKTPQRRWSDEGSVPVAMHRWATDQRLFRLQRRKQGGTLLLDASGSMHFTASDIARIVQQAPGATVAMYSGNGMFGQLTIIGRHGRAACGREIRRIRDEVDTYNSVDGPALRWLARQPEPRVWMSDGECNGMGTVSSPNLIADASIVCQQGNIRKVANIEEATALFATKH